LRLQPGRDPDHIAAGRALGRSIAAHGCASFMAAAPAASWERLRAACCRTADRSPASSRIPGGHGATRHSLGQLNELIVTEDMHARKHKMFERADAFITLPGGIGTLEEIVEIMTGRSSAVTKSRWSSPTSTVSGTRCWNCSATCASRGFIHTAERVQPLVIDNVEDIIPAILEKVEARVTSTAADEVITKL